MDRQLQKLVSPFVMVIFGATGDLTQRKLLPALFHLYQKQILPEHFFIVGFSRRDLSTDDFKEFLFQSLQKYDMKHTLVEKDWTNFSGKIFYQKGDFEQKNGYLELIDKLSQFDELLNACVPRYFYLATPPDKYELILKYLHETKLSEGCGPYFAKASTDAKAMADKPTGKQGIGKWTKVMVEKPFGRDLESAQNLDMELSHIFKEEQIYRIDHYLGKETVQNILAFRYGNTIFDPLWNNKFIDHVQITIAESLGVATRGNFYEGVGALRDMAQSHLLELMTAISMKPVKYSAETLRDARAEVIRAIVPIPEEKVAENVVRGQYGYTKSKIKNQKSNIISYRDEANVDPKSNTETYVALKIMLNDPRWQGAPFYMRTGKRLSRKVTEIAVVFKEPRLNLFGAHYQGKTNVLRFNIEPDEGITLSILAKKVGLISEFEQVEMSFTYPKQTELPEAYERLLLDAMKGDQTLFTRTDEVEASWKFISNISNAWEKQAPDFPNYQVGSWGPKAADELIKRDGREWLLR